MISLASLHVRPTEVRRIVRVIYTYAPWGVAHRTHRRANKIELRAVQPSWCGTARGRYKAAIFDVECGMVSQMEVSCLPQPERWRPFAQCHPPPPRGPRVPQQKWRGCPDTRKNDDGEPACEVLSGNPFDDATLLCTPAHARQYRARGRFAIAAWPHLAGDVLPYVAHAATCSGGTPPRMACTLFYGNGAPACGCCDVTGLQRHHRQRGQGRLAYPPVS